MRIADLSRAQGCRGNDHGRLFVFVDPLALVGSEEEQLVLPDRAAERSAVRVSIQAAGGVRQSRSELSLLVEPVVCWRNQIASPTVQTAVKLVAPTLGENVDLRSRRAAGIRIESGGRNAKLLDGVQS